MATVPAENVAEIEIRGQLNGIPVENTLYAHFVGTLTNIILSALAAAIQTWFVEEFLPHLAAGYVFKEVYVRDLSAGSGNNGMANTSSGSPGTDTTDTLPGNVAWAVKFVTGLAGRSFRGRNYVCGFGEDAMSGNTLVTGLANTLLGNYRMLLGGGDVLPDGWTWGVLSRQHLGSPRVEGLFTPITGVSYTDLTVDSQRKRLH